MQLIRSCLLVCAIALLCARASAQQPASGFLTQLQQGVAASGAGGANGTTGSGLNCDQSKLSPANIIVESVIPVPGPGMEPQIVLRNTGGQLANLTGWRLALGNDSASAGGDNVLYIADNVRCRPNGTLPAGGSLIFTPRSDRNPCGFPFNLSESGTVTLSDYEDQAKSQMVWDQAAQGTQIHTPESGTTAIRVPAGSNVVDVLKSLGNFQTFLLALQSTGLDQQLTAASDPAYAGPQLPTQQFVLDLPWWFFGSQPAAAAAMPMTPASTEPTTPPPVGIPAQGPYTILAPTDEAFDKLLTTLGGANGPLPLDALLRQPSLKDILLYHIIPGRYTSNYLRNNTAIYTAKGVEVVPIVDGCQTNGKIAFHDSCVDKPTGDNFTCAEQRNFMKCDFPFMISPLAAQWQGGFCQRTCQRCDCSPGSGVQCSISTISDIDASNGVIQGINRVLFPPPVFTKEQAIRDAIAFNESAARNASMGLPTPPGFEGLTGALAPTPGAPGAPGALGVPGMMTSNATLLPAPGAANTTAPAAASPAAAIASSPDSAAAGPTDVGGSPAPADASTSPSPSPASTDAASSPAPGDANSTSASPASTDAASSPAPGAGRRLMRW